MSIKIESLRVEKFIMDFFRFGKGEKALVILPGLSVQSVMGAAEAISDEYSVMKDEFTVYVFDRRKVLPPSYSIKDMADDTALAIEALGLRDVYLFGASQGGMIALEIAAHYHDNIKKVAVASTSLNVSDEQFAVIKGWIEKAKAKDGTGLYIDFGKTIYPADVYEKYKYALIEAGKTVTDNEMRRFITLAEAVKGYSSGLNAGDIHCPLFAVGSVDDGIFGESSIREIIETFKELPGFKYHLYESFGHAVYDTAPDFRERLYGFFTEKNQ